MMSPKEGIATLVWQKPDQAVGSTPASSMVGIVRQAGSDRLLAAQVAEANWLERLSRSGVQPKQPIPAPLAQQHGRIDDDLHLSSSSDDFLSPAYTVVASSVLAVMLLAILYFFWTQYHRGRTADALGTIINDEEATEKKLKFAVGKPKKLGGDAYWRSAVAGEDTHTTGRLDDILASTPCHDDIHDMVVMKPAPSSEACARASDRGGGG